MPLTNPERPRQEAEARVEAAPKKEGFKVVRLEDVAVRREAAAQAEVKKQELTEKVARDEMAQARETAAKNPGVASRILAEAGPKERVAQKAAAEREMAVQKVTEARAAKELIHMEQDPAAMDAWERTREKEAGDLNKELKQNPENKQARDRLAQVTVELNTVMNLANIKQELSNWDRAQRQPRVEAPRIAA